MERVAETVDAMRDERIVSRRLGDLRDEEREEEEGEREGKRGREGGREVERERWREGGREGERERGREGGRLSSVVRAFDCRSVKGSNLQLWHET